MADATQRPPANVSRPTMPWARRIEAELDQRAKDAEAIASRHASTHETVLALMRKMPRPGSLNYRGPWHAEVLSVGPVARIWGGYVDGFAYNGLPPHSYEVVDGTLVPFVFGDGSPDERNITVTGTFEYDIPEGVDTDNIRPVAFFLCPSGAELDGDIIHSVSLGTTDALSPRVQGGNEPGHHVIPLQASGPAGDWGSTMAVVAGGIGYGSSGSWTQLSVTIDGAGAPANLWRSGRLPAPGSVEVVGDNYAPGDVVLYNAAMWMAVTETDENPPGPGQWALLAGSAADAFAGEWS